MATDVNSIGGQFRSRGRRVSSFWREGNVHLPEQKRGRLLGQVRFEFPHLLLTNIDLAFRTAGVLFANLIFEGCLLETGSSRSIVEVEGCSSSRIKDNIQLHHVSFENNTLINGAGLAMQSPSCFELELIDFVFENNTCDGRCGVILAIHNRLRDVIIRRNKPSDTANANTTVFYAPPGSETSVNRMNSLENRCSSVKVQDASLDMTRCTFIQNSIAAGQDGVNSTSLNLTSATVSIKECRFQQNTAQIGGVIAGSRSNVTFIDSAFDANAASSGGVMAFDDDSTVSIQSCNFSSNTALQSGGILFARSSQLFVSYSFLEKNSANGNGGCFCLDNSSNLEMSFATMTDNQAVFGGVLVIRGEASGNVTHSSFHMNDASTSGGAAFVQASTLSLEKCRLANGSAEYGGGITAVSSNISVLESTASNLSASKEGGFVVVRADSVLRMSDCICSGNQASFGGCMHVKENSLGIVTDCQFDKNDASTSGGAAFVRSSTFLVQKCHVANGSAEYGGGITAVSSNISVLESTASNLSASKEGEFVVVRADSVLRMSDCICSGNQASFGGCMHVKENSLGIVTYCQFDKNDASTSGGSAYVKDSVLSVHTCSFVNGSAVNGGGIISFTSNITVDDTSAFDMSAVQYGGFLAGKTFNIRMKDCSFSGNQADFGGAICLLSNSSGNITDCQFAKNSASTSGGAAYVKDSVLSVQKSSFVNGSAAQGGAIHSFFSNISIWKTDASGQSASELGGAIYFSKSVFKINNVKISECEAESDGGAIMGINSSRLLCSGCILIDNKARRGGAIFFKYNDTQSISMQLDNSILQNNSAEYGGTYDKNIRKKLHSLLHLGGIQIAAETLSLLQNCRTEHDECRVVAMANTSLMDNRARSAGGAIFIDTVAGLRLNCSDRSKEEELQFFSKEQWMSMRRLVSIYDICPSWKNNTAERYGRDVATSAFGMRKEIADEQTGLPRSVNGNNYTIHNHRSGKPIPVISLTLVDELGQGPVVGENNETIKAVMSSPDGFFTGSVSRPLGIESANFNATGFVKPGVYKVKIEFEGTDLESFEITVEVKPCEMGEVPSGNGTFCESCNAVSFNFSPEEDLECHPCPENGDCSSQVILPNKGYWHRTPCSERVQRCLTTEACDSDNREDELAELTQDVESCDFNEQYLQNYTEAQCREVRFKFD